MGQAIRLCLGVVTIISASAAGVCGADKPAVVGQSERVYTLDANNTEIRGLAFDDMSSDARRLFVLDGSAKIFVYRSAGEDGDLRLAETIDLPENRGGSDRGDARGLAYAFEDDHDVFYWLNQDSGGHWQLWRSDFKENSHTHIDLAWHTYGIGRREAYDLTYNDGNVFVCFDSSGYKDNDLRVARGVIKLRYNRAGPEKFEFVKHMPDSGEFTSRGLAYMELEGAGYLWATAGDEHIYSAEAETGRGLFYFDRPQSDDGSRARLGLAFGDNALWVGEGTSGADRVHRVNVVKNLNAYYEGPHILRHLVMTIRTEPEGPCEHAGKVYHHYSRPYSYEQLHNQGVWPETERLVDTSDANNASAKKFTYDPAGDVASRQHMGLVEYADAPARSYSSRYEIDIWTNEYRKYIYPHRVDRNVKELAGTNYLADDPNLFNLSDKATYDGLFKRVAAHIRGKYGVAADMKNPYWAIRNVLEYVQDNYYYPGREYGRPAAVDYSRNHYDANPGNLKLALSDRPYDKTQITACSGTSVMLAGAMRYLGIQARWLGTGVEKGPVEWDKNHNGLLDEGESAPCSNGHRYTQVWLGSNYGWICFDATPSRPEYGDYDPVPPIKSQWRYMNRAARGHLLEKRIVFNVGSALFMPLYRDFEYDERLAADNNCGGDQRYNLQGRYEKRELWKLPRHSITVENMCFVRDIAVSGPAEEKKVTWKLEGKWDKDPEATVSLYLQQVSGGSGRARNVATLVKGLAWDRTEATVDLKGYSGRSYRIIIRKDGDGETGGQSQEFDLK